MAYLKKKINLKRIITVVLILFLVYAAGLYYKTTVDGINVKKEEEKLLSQIKEEQNKKAVLEKKKAALNSDESIENLARDELGFLKPGETAFYDFDKK